MIVMRLKAGEEEEESANIPEMYGKEDGSVPATFQIIFMVRPLHSLFLL